MTELPTWMTELLGDIPASVWRSIDETKARDAVALAYATNARESGTRPQIEYRCKRCGHALVLGWNTPAAALVLWHPRVRLADARAAEVSAPGGVLSRPRKTAGGLVIPARANVFDAGRAVWLGCEHRWGRANSDQILADWRSALATRRSVQRIAD